MFDVMHPNLESEKDPGFPNAPQGWTKAQAQDLARDEGVEMREDHWEAIRALQRYFSTHLTPHVRELHDALDEKFHTRGGIKYLYQILPGGPVAQGCRLAGLEPPAGAADRSFGSVQ
jgi:tRNA 2-thiouridine synthesizing protein E